MKLERRYVEKPWGRTQLLPMFHDPSGERIGEVWFTNGADLPLLAKYIFTSERLSIQVHPNDKQAQARGFAQGKSECWYILEAEPGATLGLGLKRRIDDQELRAAALDGSIEELMDWRPVQAGDFVFVPSGTVHAIGAGISLLEFQQNSDVTYRLYDYGRPRELHLDDGVAVSKAEPFPDDLIQHVSGADERTLVNGPHFTLALTDQDALRDRQRWVLPLGGEVQDAGEKAGPGDCLLLQPGEALQTSGARLLIGATAGRS
jgi:mannose-6-phosphate isomerase